LKLLGIEKKVTVIGIAKRLEELYYPGDQYPLYLDKKSETLKIIQHLRDEAHRFGITFHRNQRSRKTFVSELDNIPGIGKATVEKLLKTFRSVKRVREASDEELKQVLHTKQLKALRTYFG
jgi:excinuclease ABC subunit C